MTRVRTLTVAVSQDTLSQQLWDEIRAVVEQEKYGYMQDCTLIGILEMLKCEYIQRNRE